MKQLKIHPSARLRNLIEYAPNKPNINDENFNKYTMDGLPATVQINRFVERYTSVMYCTGLELIDQLSDETWSFILNAECVDSVKTPRRFFTDLVEYAQAEGYDDIVHELASLSEAQTHALCELEERFWHHRIINVGNNVKHQLKNLARTLVEPPFLEVDIAKHWEFTGVEDSDTIIAVKHAPGNLTNSDTSQLDFVCSNNWSLDPELDIDELLQDEDFQFAPGTYQIAGFRGAYECVTRDEWDAQGMDDDDEIYFATIYGDEDKEFVIALLDPPDDFTQNRTAEIDVKICEAIFFSKAWLF